MFQSGSRPYLRLSLTTAFRAAVILLSAALLLSGCSNKKSSDIILATTTSTYDTGLLDELIPVFTKQYGYKVKPIAVGTGEALTMGESGEADVLLVHAPAAEKAFMAAGYGLSRKKVMYNWFLLVGPEKDVADAAEADNIAAAFQGISKNRAPFISRGDDSGTHKKELALWKASKKTPEEPWYQEAGQGMGATLRIADEKQGYTLTDEGTFRAQQKSLSLQAFDFTGQDLKNNYSVIVVTKNPGSKAFSRFLVSRRGQSLIRKFRSPEYKKTLFTPDAK